MKVKGDFQHTEQSIIPDEWEAVPLFELVTEFRGGAPLQPRDFTLRGIKVLPKGAVGRTGWLQTDDTNQQYCSPTFAAAHPNNQVDKSFTIVVLRDLVPSGPTIGLIVQIKESDTFVLAQGVYGFKVLERCEPSYLVQLSHTHWYRQLMNSIMVGSTQVHITNPAFKRVKVPLPKPAEQRAIVDALSDVDALLGDLARLTAKKRDLKQAAMQQLLTGQTRLPGFATAEYIQTEVGPLPDDWKVVEVKKVTRSHKQGFYTKDRYVDRGVKLARITDLMNPRIDYPAMPMLNISVSDHDLYKISIGDFLFARSGAIGRYGIVNDDVDAVFGSYIIRFSFDPDQLSNEYFGFLYETQIVWKQLLSITQGSSNMNINAGNIKALRIPLPSLPEQTAIAEVLTDMDAELSVLTQRRKKTRALKQAMIQELLTGKTRLI